MATTPAPQVGTQSASAQLSASPATQPGASVPSARPSPGLWTAPDPVTVPAAPPATAAPVNPEAAEYAAELAVKALENAIAALDDAKASSQSPDSLKQLEEKVSAARAKAQVAAADNLVLSAVANLFPYKGHADLLAALHELRAHGVRDWILLAAGKDVTGHLADLLRMADALGLSGHLRFLGQRRDVPVILSAADIHISASHEEGFPNNIVEAMCAGLPVVATAVGGVPELVVDGATGVLVPARHPPRMAEALQALAGDPQRRRAMGVAGRARGLLDRAQRRRARGDLYRAGGAAACPPGAVESFLRPPGAPHDVARERGRAGSGATAAARARPRPRARASCRRWRACAAASGQRAAVPAVPSGSRCPSPAAGSSRARRRPRSVCGTSCRRGGARDRRRARRPDGQGGSARRCRRAAR